MMRGQLCKQMGENVPESRSRKCRGSEVNLLVMSQGPKKEPVWLVVTKQEMGLEGGQGGLTPG